jgi:hypothetical protein
MQGHLSLFIKAGFAHAEHQPAVCTCPDASLSGTSYFQKKRRKQAAAMTGREEVVKEPSDGDLVEDVIFNPRPEDEVALKAHRRRVNPAVDLDADKDAYEGYGLAHNAARSELVRGVWE